MRDILPHADIIFCNHEEALACDAKMMGAGDVEGDAASRLLLVAEKIVRYKKVNASSERPRVVVITNSAKNVILALGHPDSKEITKQTIPLPFSLD